MFYWLRGWLLADVQYIPYIQKKYGGYNGEVMEGTIKVLFGSLLLS